MTTSLLGKFIVITGVGFKPVEYVFRDITTNEPSHTPIRHDSVEYKANIGAATALECTRAGATVHLVARTEKKLEIIKDWIQREVEGAKVEYTSLDLSDVEAMKRFVGTLPQDKIIYWVQSVGLGAGTVQLKDDNPYLTIENISEDLVGAELSVLQNTISMLQCLLPRFRKQKETRVCIISSMSAIRSVWSGSIHNAAKGAISRFANAAMIELDKEKIYITDIRPGGVDTGLYDLEIVQDTIVNMAKSYGVNWSKEAGGLRLMPPTAVGKAIVTALSSEAHITSLNLVARGQWPHEGS